MSKDSLDASVKRPDAAKGPEGKRRKVAVMGVPIEMYVQDFRSHMIDNKKFSTLKGRCGDIVRKAEKELLEASEEMAADQGSKLHLPVKRELWTQTRADTWDSGEN